MTTKENIKNRYIEHLKTLKSNDLTIDEIKINDIALYQRILKGVVIVDDCALNGDIESFLRAITLLEKLYIEAVKNTTRRILQ